MKFLRLVLLVYSLSLLSLNGQINTEGIHFVTNYFPANTPIQQYWSILSDSRGVMYFANDIGKVIEYDGYNWRDIPIPNGSFVRSMGISENGRIYIGAVGEFGYLTPDLHGSLKYRSLVSKTDSLGSINRDIWNLLVRNNEILFCSGDYIYKYHPQEDTLINIDLNNLGYQSCFWCFNVNNRILISDSEYGILELSDDDISVMPGASKFRGKVITVMLPYSNDEILIGVWSESLYIYNTKTGNIRLMIDDEQHNEVISKAGIYHGTIFGNDRYLFASKYGGAIMVDKNGDIDYNISEADNISEEDMSYIYTNASMPMQYPVWIATPGIRKLEANSPLTMFNEVSGLIGDISDITRFNEDLYVATNKGVQIMIPDTFGRTEFKVIEGINVAAWCLLPIHREDTDNSTLMAGTDNGIFEIDKDGNVSKIDASYKGTSFSTERSYKLVWSRFSPDIFYACGEKQLLRFEYKNKWKVTGYVPFTDEIRDVAEIDTNSILGVETFSGITKLNLAGSDYIREKINLDNVLMNDDRIEISFVDGEYLFGTTSGIYKYDDANETLVPCADFSEKLTGGDCQIYRIYKDFDQDYWITGSDENSNELMFIVSRNNGNPVINDTIFKILPNLVNYNVFPDKNGIVWFNRGSILYRYDKNFHKDFNIPYFTLIREVSIGMDSVIFGGTYFMGDSRGQLYPSIEQPDLLKPTLDYEFNTISLKWSAPFFEKEEELVFRTSLKGYSKGWSNWSKGNEFTYTNLRKGNYVFVVQAKNIYGILSVPAEYEFTIKPPWYATIFAFIVYLLLFILFVKILVRINTIRLKRENVKLEKIVSERTSEVVEQKKIIEEKNRKITESIAYSKVIQDSFLIKQDEMEAIIPDAFVYFRPRDIVSGDFYWFARQGDFIVIAAVDCTGHGVPGAFMSMIGNTLLNFIVKEKGIVKPSEILNNLNHEVIKALRQEHEESMSQDGMDIAVCTIDHSNETLQFSGAKNSLYMVIGNDLRIFRADPSSIGGTIISKRRSKTANFTNHEIKIISGSSIYMITDGYVDQPGGANNTSYNTNRLSDLLLSVSKLSPSEQYRVIDQEMNEWMKSTKQIDDMLIIGIKL